MSVQGVRITQQSDLAAAQEAYVENADYEEVGSTAKAKAFITACRILLLKLPKESGTREGHLQLNPELIQKEMEDARDWVDKNKPTTEDTAGGRVTRASFTYFRD